MLIIINTDWLKHFTASEVNRHNSITALSDTSLLLRWLNHTSDICHYRKFSLYIEENQLEFEHHIYNTQSYAWKQHMPHFSSLNFKSYTETFILF